MIPVLEIDDLHVELRLRQATVRALDGVSLTVGPGECLGLVGESGCGKTMTALSVLQLLPAGGQVTGGQVRLAGREISALGEPDMRRVRGNEVGMIFQDPMSALNPMMTVGDQIAESVRVHRRASRAAARERAVEALGLVGMPRPAERAGQYPHQLSGGMRQRAMIAIALACEPKLLIADEPTTALDVTIQQQILELIDQLRAQLGMAVVLVTHDLGVIAGRADRVAVMYAGKVVETTSTAALFTSPRHPYTEALFAALPEKAAGSAAPLYSIPGAPPDLTRPATACAFAPRCQRAQDQCREAEPGPAGDPLMHAYRCFFPVGAAAEDPGPGGGAPKDGLAVTEAPRDPPARPPSLAGPAPLLQVDGLTKDFPAGGGTLRRRRAGLVSAVAEVSFGIAAGETFGMVGESGCGKTTIGRMIAGLERPTAGSVILDGENLTAMPPGERRRRSAHVQLMFQDSGAAMDPLMRAGSVLREPLAIQRRGSRAEQRARVAGILAEVGLPPAWAERFPHEFSGGQRQRLGLARALILRPRLIVADEPVSALDVSIQAQVLNLMRDLQRDHGLTYLFISHDLSVVRYLADRIGVMYLGKLVETGPAAQVYDRPAHPYTRGLIDAVPVATAQAEQARGRAGVTGELPSAVRPPSGCRFRTRCPRAQDLCARQEPPLRSFTAAGQQAACHFPLREPEAALPAPATAR
ncbi:MAG TPA: ABC transporter ATP-binding protein [Streptosporangiaceae bacterium]|jgi:peptide/nickel transport system ATP-binding protein